MYLKGKEVVGSPLIVLYTNIYIIILGNTLD